MSPLLRLRYLVLFSLDVYAFMIELFSPPDACAASVPLSDVSDKLHARGILPELHVLSNDAREVQPSAISEHDADEPFTCGECIDLEVVLWACEAFGMWASVW